MGCVASISAVLASPPTGTGQDGAHPAVSDEYWAIIRGRTLSSMMGIVVGALGIRGAYSLSTRTIRLYFVGLMMCAALALALRIQLLIDIILGKVGSMRTPFSTTAALYEQ